MDALYRKYRPRKFSEIVGQDHVKKILMRAIVEGKVSHAYIFAGPRGTGKTTTARILVKALNCENREGAEPCGKCYACRAIDEGTFMDVVELDAASNRGIDEIRKIKEGASFRPIEGKYKAYIIDEVHMLTREAFNALLKTLEEPPPHVVFILATTNLEKVPPTIISRCQVLEFRNLPKKLIIKRLKEICEREGIEATDEALEYIAKKSMGGMRDAITILEQVWKFSGKKIDVKSVEEALGLIDSDVIEKYLDGVLNGDIEKVMDVVNDVYYSGKEMDVLFQEALDMALERIESGKVEYLNVTQDLLRSVREIKFFENKRIYALAFSLSLAGKFSSVQGVPNNAKEPAENSEKEENVSEAKETPEDSKGIQDDLRKLLEYLKTDGDLAVYVALSLADELRVENGTLYIVFSKDKEFSYLTLRERILELEESVRKTLGDLKIELSMTGESKRAEEMKKRILSLFGEIEEG